MPSHGWTRVSLAFCVLSTSACAEILGLDDFSFGDGGSTSTSTNAGGNGGEGAGVSEGGMGGAPVVVGGAGGVGGDGGSGGMPNICDDPVTYANLIVCDAPVLYLRFEEDSVAQPMTNDSPLGVLPNGSYGGAAFTAGVAGIGGNALQQGPGRSAVTDPNSVLDFSPTDPYSVETWVRAPDHSGSDLSFIGNWDGGTQGHALFVFPASEADGTPMDIEVKRNTGPDTLFCSNLGCGLVVDSFQHVVVTYEPESGEVILYLDGQSQGTATMLNALIAPPTDFGISGPDNEFVVFDEIAVYDYVLDESQVAAHFTCGSGNGC